MIIFGEINLQPTPVKKSFVGHAARPLAWVGDQRPGIISPPRFILQRPFALSFVRSFVRPTAILTPRSKLHTASLAAHPLLRLVHSYLRRAPHFTLRNAHPTIFFRGQGVFFPVMIYHDFLLSILDQLLVKTGLYLLIWVKSHSSTLDNVSKL